MIRLYRENEVETHNILWKRFLYILFSPLRLTALLSIQFISPAQFSNLSVLLLGTYFLVTKSSSYFLSKKKNLFDSQLDVDATSNFLT